MKRENYSILLHFQMEIYRTGYLLKMVREYIAYPWKLSVHIFLVQVFTLETV